MKEINKKENRPAGVLVLGGLNFLILGLGSLLVLSFLYFRSDSQTFTALLAEMAKYFGAQPEVEVVKKVILIQMGVSAVFALTGLGLLLGKEAARKATVYFSFFVVLLTFAAALFNRGVVRQAFVQIIYPGILIVYLTNKNVEGYFRGLPAVRQGLPRQEKPGD